MLTLINLLFFKKIKSVFNLKKVFKKYINGHTITWHGGRGLPPWRMTAGS
jgi:hypothetical protein